MFTFFYTDNYCFIPWIHRVVTHFFFFQQKGFHRISRSRKSLDRFFITIEYFDSFKQSSVSIVFSLFFPSLVTTFRASKNCRICVKTILSVQKQARNVITQTKTNTFAKNMTNIPIYENFNQLIGLIVVTVRFKTGFAKSQLKPPKYRPKRIVHINTHKYSVYQECMTKTLTTGLRI